MPQPPLVGAKCAADAPVQLTGRLLQLHQRVAGRWLLHGCCAWLLLRVRACRDLACVW
jgi:hypothetical protein